MVAMLLEVVPVKEGIQSIDIKTDLEYGHTESFFSAFYAN